MTLQEFRAHLAKVNAEYHPPHMHLELPVPGFDGESILTLYSDAKNEAETVAAKIMICSVCGLLFAEAGQ